MLIFWWIFSKFSEKFQEMEKSREFQIWIASQAEKHFKRLSEKLSALRVPGGNQVDGLPPARHTKTVAKRGRLGARTQMHLTMKVMFLNVKASQSMLGSLEWSFSYVLRLWMEMVRLQNANTISEFYLLKVFLKKCHFWYFFEKSGFFFKILGMSNIK